MHPNIRIALNRRRKFASLEELKVREQEHSEVQIQLGRLEGLRDRHAELLARIRQEAVRLGGTEENLVKTGAAIKELLLAQARLTEIAPCREEAKRLDAERKLLVLECERLDKNELRELARLLGR